VPNGAPGLDKACFSRGPEPTPVATSGARNGWGFDKVYVPKDDGVNHQIPKVATGGRARPGYFDHGDYGPIANKAHDVIILGRDSCDDMNKKRKQGRRKAALAPAGVRLAQAEGRLFLVSEVPPWHE